MKIKWILEIHGGLRIIAGSYFSFIIDGTNCMYIRGNIRNNTSLKYLRIKQRLKIENWL